MKKSIIRKIFNGERGIDRLIRKTEEECKLDSLVSDTYDELIKHLSPEQLKLHEIFIEAREEAFYEEINNNYVEGFKLGLLVGIECISE